MKQTPYKYRLKEIYEQLPRSVSVKHILEQVGIARRTFYKDLSIKLDESADIPGSRLQKYALVLGVSLESLYTTEPMLGKLKEFNFKTRLG